MEQVKNKITATTIIIVIVINCGSKNWAFVTC